MKVIIKTIKISLGERSEIKVCMTTIVIEINANILCPFKFILMEFRSYYHIIIPDAILKIWPKFHNSVIFRNSVFYFKLRILIHIQKIQINHNHNLYIFYQPSYSALQIRIRKGIFEYYFTIIYSTDNPTIYNNVSSI